MKVLIIDNYDSFVFNLERYVVELGATTRVCRNDAISVAEVKAYQPTHIILSPGPCTPNEAGICLDLVSELAGEVPILGVCLGHQVIGQVLGGQVVRAQKPLHGQASLIYHNQTGLFEHLPPTFSVGRYHSLVVLKEGLDAKTSLCAWSREQEIMALSDFDRHLYGLQFHPESILTEHGYDLLRAFLAVSIPVQQNTKAD